MGMMQGGMQPGMPPQQGMGGFPQQQVHSSSKRLVPIASSCPLYSDSRFLLQGYGHAGGF